MSDSLPMFPLNAVLFPGVSVPLKVFEDRYRALVHHLLRVPDPTERVFGSVGIREGYEVGDHGAQSLFRVGCRVKLTEVESHPDGTFDIVAVGMDRIELERLDTTRRLPGRARGATVPSSRPRSRRRSSSGPARRSRRTAWRSARSAPTPTPATCRRTRRTCPGRWRPSRRCRCTSGRPCSRPRTPSLRLVMVTDLLRTELRAMNVIPSLPATEVARTRWSPELTD